MYLYIIFGIIVILLVIDIFQKKKLISKEDILINKIIDKYKEDLELRFNAFEKENEQKKEKITHELDLLGARLDTARTNTDQAIAQYQQTREAQERAGAEYVRTSTEKNNEEIHRHFDNEVNDYRNATARLLESIREDAQKELEEYLASNEELAQKKRIEIDELDKLIQDFKEKREVINQEILRQRAIEEKQDFYRVCLSDGAKNDIQILRSVAPSLSNPSLLNKAIYGIYVSKPAQEMIKRVLNGAAPSGIYKITRLKTGEIYVGKSTNVKDRWGQHLKTAFGVGTIAHSILHTTMEKDGISEFTFELLEEVPKENLSAREKYWIEFYGSKEYGLNEKAGG